MIERDLIELEQKIGYKFHDRRILVKSLTHPSCETKENNQFLEYLGDSLLDFLVADYLYENYPDMNEGDATKIRASIVSRWPLAKLFDSFDFIKVINVRNINLKTMKVKLKSDFVEAVLGAIYIDGGIDSARKFVIDFLCGKENYAENHDYKSQLFEYGAKNGFTITFENSSTGAQHKQHFYSTVFLNGEPFGSGEGDNKRSAEQRACQKALEKINNVRS